MNIPKDNLSEAIAIASAALPRKASLPAYSQLLLVSNGGVFMASATDGDQWASGFADCNSAIEPFCVSARSLESLLPLMADNVWMELKEGRLHITSGGNLSLAVSPASDFPSWSTEGSKALGMNCADLAKAIRSVEFASARDMTNKAPLCNVWIRCSEKFMTAQGANGRELALYKAPAICAKCDFLLPVAMVKNFCEALEQEGAVLWLLGDDKATVKHAQGEYSTKLWAGKYMNYDEVLKYPRTALGEINPKAWLPIFKSFIADEADSKLTCRVIIERGTIYHTGVTSKAEIPTPDKMEPHQIRVNAVALVSVLEQFDGKTSLFLNGDNAVGFEQGNLLVLSTMLGREG